MTRCIPASGKHSPPLAQHLADRRLAREIRCALEATGQRPLVKCEITVDGGVAVLRGSVPSFHLKQLAQEAALNVDGVERVENELRVRRSLS